MRIALYLLFVLIAITAIGCAEKDSKVNLAIGVKNDSLTNNTVVRAVSHTCSAIIGEGVAVDETFTKRNEKGLLELCVKGHNNSQFIKRFWYRPQWIDSDGMTIPSRTSVWNPISVREKEKFNFKVTAPMAKAADVKIETKKWE